MDLRQIEYTVAIVDHGGFTRAAAALHVAQPSLSQSVRRLEAELGAPLFVRLGRQVRPSAAGLDFLGPARRVLREVVRAREAVTAHAALSVGTLDVVALPTLVAEPLAGLIGRFRHAHPYVTVRVHEPDTPRRLLDMVRDGRCEVGVTEMGHVPDGLHQHVIGRQVFLAVLPPGRPGSAEPLSLPDLAREALIVTPLGTSTRSVIDDALRQAGAEAEVAVETTQRDAIVPLVLAGAGSSILPEPLAREAERRGAVVRALSPEVTRSIGLVHPDDDLSPAARAFVALAVALAVDTAAVDTGAQ